MVFWLLEHASPSCGPLVGDLLEERNRGRSRSWLWRQVVVAVAQRCVRDVRAHGLLAVAALVTGWFFVLVAGLADSVGFFQLQDIRLSRLVTGLVPAQSVHAGLFLDGVFAAALIALAVASGWLVASLFRPLGTSAVLVYCVSFSLFGAYRMLVHAAGWYDPSEQVLAEVPGWVIAPWSDFRILKVALYFPLFSAGILLGGYLATCQRWGARLSRA